MSQKEKWLRFAELARLLAPSVIAAVDPKLAPLANTIAHGISVAEAMPGKTGAEKLAYVQLLAHDSAVGVNQGFAANGKSEPIDLATLDAASANAINTAVAVINLTHKSVVLESK